MAVKTFTTGEVLTAADTNTYLNNGGLVYVKSQTIGTAVSSVTVSSAFSADFDNYKIVINGGAASASPSLSLTLGSTATGYYVSGLFVQFGTTAVTGLNVSNGTAWTNMGRAAANGIASAFDLYDPFNARRTGVTTLTTDYLTAGYFITQGGFLDNATSYTAFTITPASGTLTGGTITVYGYRKA